MLVVSFYSSPTSSFADRWMNRRIVSAGHFTGGASKVLFIHCVVEQDVVSGGDDDGGPVFFLKPASSFLAAQSEISNVP